jgi:hypothetical protein
MSRPSGQGEAVSLPSSGEVAASSARRQDEALGLAAGRARERVDEVDQTAALTPGPRDTMTQIDRAALALAKRAPSAARLVFRVRRGSRRRRFRRGE